VKIGTDITVEELQRHYDGVVLSFGAEDDRELGITGERTPSGSELGAHSARAFVGWYNGHPDHRHLNPDLSVEKVMVIGQGNVALDVARVLLSPVEELAKTDITSYALEQLAKSKVREVKLVGRRGPVQAAFTIKEFREMTKLPDCQVIYDDHEGTLRMIAEAKPQWSKDRPKKRMMELLEQNGAKPADVKPKSRKGTFKFLRSPVEIKRDPEGKVRSLVMAVNILDPATEKAMQTTQHEEEECGMVLRSIGYKSLPITGIPFDAGKGLVPNINGRVCTDATLVSPPVCPETQLPNFLTLF